MFTGIFWYGFLSVQCYNAVTGCLLATLQRGPRAVELVNNVYDILEITQPASAEVSLSPTHASEVENANRKVEEALRRFFRFRRRYLCVFE